MSYIRRNRHWKQRFDESADFVWRRRITMNGRVFEPGDPVDKDLFPASVLRVKLRRFWEAGAIELAKFDRPDAKTGEVVDEDVPRIVARVGPWYTVAHRGQTHRALGKKKLEALMKELTNAAA